MYQSSKSAQRGVAFMGMLSNLLLLAVLAYAVVIGIQVVPMVLEFKEVERAAQRATAGQSVVEVQTLFDRSVEINNIKSITGKDIEVTKDADKVIVAFAYEREIPIIGPAYFTLKFAGRSN